MGFFDDISRRKLESKKLEQYLELEQKLTSEYDELVKKYDDLTYDTKLKLMNDAFGVFKTYMTSRESDFSIEENQEEVNLTLAELDINVILKKTESLVYC